MQKIRDLLRDFINAINDNPVDHWLLSPVRRKKIFRISLLVLLAWQGFFFMMKFQSLEKFARRDTGFNHWWGQEFVYFDYYKNIFPLATTVENKQYSEAGADAIIKNDPRSLRMEWHHWSSLGESARTWLYMPYCFVTGSAENPQINFITGILFIAALLWLFFVFWKMEKPFLGMLLIFLIGSSPFLVFENYNHNNVFGLMATSAIFLFCMHAAWFTKAFRFNYLVIAIVSGIFSGLMYNIRAESQAMALACLVIYFFAFNQKWWQRFLLMAGFCIAFVFTSSSIQKHFERKFDEAYHVVKEAGGPVFDGMKIKVHPLWHSLYCGLGDFDRTYGHILHDTAVYNEVLPLLRKKTGLPLVYPGRTKYEMGEYYDVDSFYYKKPETVEGYDMIAKEKFFSAVKTDPGWYTGILLKRTNQFLYDTSPLALNFGNHLIKIPFTGYFLLILLMVFVYFRQWYWIKFLLFTLPLGSAVILVYYSEHNSYQSVYHFFAAALIVYGVVGMLRMKNTI